MTALILSAFGSNTPAATAARDDFQAIMQRAFPDYSVSWAFGSSRLRSQLGVPSLSEQLQQLAASGCARAIVQSVHLVPGQMDAEAEAHVAGIEVLRGRPLLCTDADFDQLVEVLLSYRRPGVPNIVALHGNGSKPHYNGANLQLARLLLAADETLSVGSLEGEPGDPITEPLIAQARATNAAHVIPAFVFPGGHVNDDILGTEPDSWANRLGVPLTVAPCLAQMPGACDLWMNHTREAH